MLKALLYPVIAPVWLFTLLGMLSLGAIVFYSYALASTTILFAIAYRLKHPKPRQAQGREKATQETIRGWRHEKN